MMDEFLAPNSNFIRLVGDWEKYGSITVGFDFDGTVHDYHKKGHTYHMTRQLLKELKEIGCSLICWTAYENLAYVHAYLQTHDIPYDSVNEGGIPLPWKTVKPFFSALLDDRAGLESAYRDLSLLVWYVKKHNLQKK
jgi:hypothetical protein